MLSAPKQKQRRVDVACGYALGAYLGVTLMWMSILISPSFSIFAMLTAMVAGIFGTLRSFIVLPMRFWLIPLVSMLYVSALPILLAYNAAIVAITLGITHSAAFALPIYRLFKHDFAKTIPPWLCKACGYPLMRLTEPSCPECGEKFDPEAVPKIATTPATKDNRLQ